MIDLLLKRSLSVEDIASLLFFVTGLSLGRIFVVANENFLSMKDHDFSQCDCLCVFSHISGDASLLLQIFRCEMETEILKKKIISACLDLKIECYVPCDSFDEWIYVSEGGEINQVVQIESELEDRYLFQAT
ncbi:TPA: hypothetical protein RY214_002253 [Pseudomonas aeruginosa]|uniref:hypothetical protein n=1 Tax=Pseudomonas aeruginosa TaxID=287 RepID=UPI00106C70CF|nr:hypothetical protein [Pseudomonas aeruginosa]